MGASAQKRINSRRRRCKAEALERRLLLSAAAPPLASVTGLTLINASSDLPVPATTLANGAVIDLGQTGHRLSILADLGPGAVGSVRFNYDGNPNFGIENSAPYAIAGNALGGREYLPWLPTVGMHTLIVTSYPGRDATGQAGEPDILLFNVIDSSTAAAPVNVNAGGTAYTDSAGNVFQADSGFFGGQQRFSNVPIAGTADPALYQSRRQGHFFGFSERVPDDTYAVTLYFADPGIGRGGNVFDVTSDRTALLTDYNIAADAGPRTAVQKTFIVPVTDGSIDLGFRAEQGDAMVSAISVAPQRVPLVESPIYVNAGGLSYTDSVGRTFEAGIGFSGGQTSQSPFLVGNTADAPLFYGYRAGPQFTFSQPAANGDYELWLEFAEPTATQPAQRVFDISANGQAILDNYDIVAEAGAKQAVAKAFDIQITNGTLDLSFQGIVGDAIVSSIVLIPKDVPSGVAAYTVRSQPESVIDASDQRNLVVIGQYIWGSINVRRGLLPPTLASLVVSQDLSPDWLVSPRSATLIPRGELSPLEQLSWAENLSDYVYLGAGKRVAGIGAVNAFTPIAYDNPDLVSGSINILFGDGHVAEYTRSDAAVLLGVPIGPPTHPPGAPSPTGPLDPSIVESLLNLRIMGLAGVYYSEFHEFRLPPDMGALAAFSDLDPSVFVDPRGSSPPPPAGLRTWQLQEDWINSTTDYLYVGAQKRDLGQPEMLIAFENPASMSVGIGMTFSDARVEFREMRWAVETILQDRVAYPRLPSTPAESMN